MSEQNTVSDRVGCGGEGGGLYSDRALSRGMNEGVNHGSALYQNQNGEGVDSVLLAFGVFALSPAKRAQVVESAALVTCSAAEMRALFDYIAEGEKDEGTARRYMAAIVGDDVRLRDAVEGLRAFLRAREAMRKVTQIEDKGPKHMANLPLGSTTCPCRACADARAAKTEAEPWDHDRMCRVAWCRVQGDRQPAAVVARDLGVSETTLGVMLERGRTLSLSPMVEGKKKLGKKQIAEGMGYAAEDDRRKAFREQMARARQGMAL